MDVGQMQRQWVDYTKSLLMEGNLGGQFLQLLQLQDENNPDFVVEVVSLFFQDSERILNDLTIALDQEIIDFKKVDSHVHQLKGSSSSIGAQRVKNACIAFRNFCEEKDVNSVKLKRNQTDTVMIPRKEEYETDHGTCLAILHRKGKEVPQMSARSKARVLPFQEQAGNSVQA